MSNQSKESTYVEKDLKLYAELQLKLGKKPPKDRSETASTYALSEKG